MTKLWAKKQLLWAVTKGILCLSQKEAMKSLRSHPKQQGHAELPDPCLKKQRAPFATVLGQKVNAQDSQGARRAFKSLSQDPRYFQPKSKAMVIQICFKNEDNSLWKMKFNEEEHNLLVIKNKKNHETKIKMFIA